MKPGNKPLSLGMIVLVAVVAGLASALLDVVSGQQRFAAYALGYLMPLPLMIVTLGFGRLAGAGAGLVGTGAVAGLVLANVLHRAGPIAPESALLEAAAFLIVTALPAWCLSYFAAPKAPHSDNGWTAPPRRLAGTYPLTRLILIAVLFAVLTEAAAIVLSAWRHGGFEADIAAKAARLVPIVERLLGPDTTLPGGLDARSLSGLIQRAVAPFDAVMRLLMYTANLWLAGRTVQVSQGLNGAWPDIARELRVSPWLAPVLAAAVGAAFLPGLAGALAMVAAAAVATAFSLQGLAVVHAVTRGASFRLPLLCVLYLLLGFLMPWPLALFSILGLVDAGFSLRERRTKKQIEKT